MADVPTLPVKWHGPPEGLDALPPETLSALIEDAEKQVAFLRAGLNRAERLYDQLSKLRGKQ